MDDEIDPNCGCQDCVQERHYRDGAEREKRVVTMSSRFAPVIKCEHEWVAHAGPKPEDRAMPVADALQLAREIGPRVQFTPATFYEFNGDMDAKANDYVRRLCGEYARTGRAMDDDIHVIKATDAMAEAKAAHDNAQEHFRTMQARRDSWRTVLSCHGVDPIPRLPDEAPA
jgi:hypothetical protein